MPTAGALRFEMLSKGKRLDQQSKQGKRGRTHVQRRRRF
jgi:hypothetical protein